MNSMPHPWNKAKHIVNSSKTEQTTGAGDHLQICYSLLLRAVCRPCHTNEDWFICVSWLGWNRMLIRLICFTSRLGPKVCVCACFPAVSLSVSHTVGYRLGLLRLFFPIQTAFVASLLESVTHRFLTCWPWAPSRYPSCPIETGWGCDLDIQSQRGQL